LTVALRDENRDVRQWAAGALGRIGNKTALEALVGALQDKTCQEHEAVAAALGGIGEPAFEPLVAALQHEDARVRKAAAMGMQRFFRSVEDPRIRVKAIEQLIRARNDQEVAGAAMATLGTIGEPAVEPMIRAMKDWDYETWVHAELALQQIGEPAVEPLLRALQDEDIRVRRAAGQGLAAVLSALHRDSHPDAREQLEKHQKEWEKHQKSILAKLDRFGPQVGMYHGYGYGGGADVAGLGFSRLSELTDEALVHLKELPGLVSLSLGSRAVFVDTDVIATNTKITDLGLEHLKELRNLEALDLSGSQVAGPGLEHLKELPNLRALCLGGTRITDAGLEHLKGLTHLQTLDLRACSVTDAGLEHLKGPANLKTLDLTSTKITDAGLEYLKVLTDLESLTLDNTRCSGSGLEHLQALSSLHELNLQFRTVTDAGLVHLSGLTSLTHLDIQQNSEVTDAGLAHLKALTAAVDRLAQWQERLDILTVVSRSTSGGHDHEP
jgi:hypothetical protein